MGFPPPPDAPSLPEQDAHKIAIGFQPTTPGILALCGFTIPGFSFSLTIPGFKLPNFAFPPPFFFFFALSLHCDAANPIDADFGFGGGRQPNLPPEDTYFDD